MNKTGLKIIFLTLNLFLILPNALAWVSIQLDPAYLPADGESTVTITATVIGPGNPSALPPIPPGPRAGDSISFAIEQGEGTINPAATTTDINGQASAAFTAGTKPERVIIRVTDTTVGQFAHGFVMAFKVEIKASDRQSAPPKFIALNGTSSYFAKTLPIPLAGDFKWGIIKKKNAEIQGSAASQSVTLKGITASKKADDTGLKVMFKPTGAEDYAVDMVDVTVVGVEVLNVDASGPFNAKVNYRVGPPDVILDSAIFTAPGKTETKNNISGNFYFTFNQKDLSIGENEIKLKANLYGGINTVTFTATRVEKSGSAKEIGLAKVAFEEGGVYFIVSVPFNHDLYERWNKIKYSIPTTAESKIIWVGKSSVNIRVSTGHGPIPTEIAMWDEYHFYKDSQGEHLRTQMLSVSGPTLPPQSEFFQSKDSSNDDFFNPDNLRGIGEVGMLVFDSDAGPVFAWPIVNSSVDLAIK